MRKGKENFLAFFPWSMEARRCMIVGRAVSRTFIFVHFFSNKISSYIELIRCEMKAAASVCISYQCMRVEAIRSGASRCY